ncbi:glycosyltransferase family 39 protein [Candidatus Sumerlaeota bacterium]|nr:glycosyltransferase family 39 protein [Candidatus Sumerlaeota bacterium]
MIVVLRTSMWIDDGATLHTVALPWGEVAAERFRMGHFPWFFYAFKLWTTLTGASSLVLLRLPSLVASVAIIPVIAGLGRRIGGERGAVGAALLAVIHGTLLRHGAELRMYSWMALAGAAMVLAALRLLEQPTARRAAVLGVVHLVFLQLQVSAIVWAIPFAVLFAAVVARRKPGAGFWRGFALATALPLLITIPLLVYLRTQVDMREFAKFDRVPSWWLLVWDPYELIVSLGTTAGRGHLWKIPAALVLPFAACLMIGRWGGKENAVGSRTGLAPRETAWLAVGCSLLPPVLAFLISRGGFPILGEPRYYIAGTGPLVALIGAACVTWRWDGSGAGRGLLVVAGILAAITAERTYDRVRRVLTRDGVGINALVAAIEKQVPPGTPVFLCHSVSFPEIAEFYFSKPLKYPLIPIHRDWNAEQIHASVDPAIKEGSGAVLFLYKSVPEMREGEERTEQGELFRIVDEKFPGDGAQVRSKNDDPGYFWFQR